MKLAFGSTLPAGVTEGTTNESVVSINDDDLPADVDVEFEQGSPTRWPRAAPGDGEGDPERGP